MEWKDYTQKYRNDNRRVISLLHALEILNRTYFLYYLIENKYPKLYLGADKKVYEPGIGRQYVSFPMRHPLKVK